MINCEIWVDCFSLVGYQVSNFGAVRSVDREIVTIKGVIKKKKGQLLKFSKTYKGYMTFRTTGKGHLVHREVIKAFTLCNPKDKHCCHIDGNKENNLIENLRWDTPKGNNKDKILHGTFVFGEKHHMAKLSNLDVEDIRKSDASVKEIMKKYKISRSHAGSIKAYRYRKYG